MTREQARREIDSLDFYLQNHSDDYGEESHTAMMMAIKALEQEPCDVPDINVGDIYECPCGYGWDKSKVVRHHFCPNCGRAVDSSYNSIKAELKPYEDAISRQDAIKKVSEILKGVFVEYEDIAQKAIGSLPSVTPQPKTGHWLVNKWGNISCSECGCTALYDKVYPGKSMFGKAIRVKTTFCPTCGAKMVEPQERSDKE